MLLHAKSLAVVLSVLMGVGGWGWSIRMRQLQMGVAVWQLWKRPPTSDSAAGATTCCRYLHSTWIGLLTCWRMVPSGACFEEGMFVCGDIVNEASTLF